MVGTLWALFSLVAAPATLVKARVEGVEVLRVEVILGDAKGIGELLFQTDESFALWGKENVRIVIYIF